MSTRVDTCRHALTSSAATCEFARMKLSLAEAATRLGKSERQVRFLIQKGRLRATKSEGRWEIDEGDLPAPPAADRAAEVRAEVARDALERALAPAGRVKFFSVTDLLAYRTGVELCRAVRGSTAEAALRGALEQLARGCHAFEPGEKVGHFAEARRLAATALTQLHLADDDALAARVERELLPKISGLVATFEKRARRRRFEHFTARLSPGTA